MAGAKTTESTAAPVKDITTSTSTSTSSTSTWTLTSNMLLMLLPQSTSSSLIAAHFVSFVVSFIIIRSFWEFENASKALAFYGVYHRYGWNQFIHFFGVPGIVWSMLIFMVHVPLPFIGTSSTSNSINNNQQFNTMNYASFLAICYNLFYLSIDPLGAVVYAPFLYGMYVSAARMMQRDQKEAAAAAAAEAAKGTAKDDNDNDANITTTTNTNTNTTNTTIHHHWYGTGKLMKFAAIVHVLCWYVQIHLGHKIIEGAQPAVLQSLGGALSVAPLFAFYEGLWLFGINAELQQSTKLLVEEYTKEICSSSASSAMKACQQSLL